MNLDFFTVASNLISLFALIAVGYAAVRFGILDDRAAPVFSAFLMKITLPCTIFISVASREYDPSFLYDGVTIMIAGLVIFTALLYVSRGLAILFRVPEKSCGTWAFSATFSNAGFMGFPIALALFGGDGLALAVMLNIAFNIVVFTVGVMEVARDNPARGGQKMSAKSIIFSGINIATVLSLISYFGRVNIPNAVATPLTFLSNITTPLSMTMIGIILAHAKSSEIFRNVHAWLNTLFSLIIYPIGVCLLLKIFPPSSNPLVAAVLVLVVAMPAASITAVICELYHGNINFAVKAMFLQNLFSVLTIPFICMFI